MIRVLGMIAIAGFVVSLACLGGAAALGGRDLARSGWNFPAWWGASHWNGYDHADINWDSPSTSRDIAWDGSSSFGITVPADVTYTQGPVAKLTVDGPESAVDRLVVRDGVLGDRDSFNHGYRHWNGARLKVTMTDPNVTRFSLMGTERLTVNNFKQDDLDIHIAGQGDVVANGEARRVALSVAGSGNADLGGVVSDEAEVHIAGSGDAKIAPKQRAEIHIAGAGNITLLTDPPEVEQHIAGSGHIYHASPAPAPAPAATPAPPVTPTAPSALPAKAHAPAA